MNRSLVSFLARFDRLATEIAEKAGLDFSVDEAVTTASRYYYIEALKLRVSDHSKPLAPGEVLRYDQSVCYTAISRVIDALESYGADVSSLRLLLSIEQSRHERQRRSAKAGAETRSKNSVDLYVRVRAELLAAYYRRDTDMMRWLSDNNLLKNNGSLNGGRRKQLRWAIRGRYPGLTTYHAELITRDLLGAS